MAISYVDYVGSGIAGPYTITFPYQEQADIVVTLDSVVTVLWSWTTATTITFDSTVASPVAIRIARETVVTSERVTFADNAVDKAVDRNRAMRQNLYRLQEIDELAVGPTGTAGTNGTNGTNGTDGFFTGAEATVTADVADKLVLADASDADAAKFALLTDFAVLAARQAFTKGQYSALATMGFGASVAPNFEAANVFAITLTGNFTLANPTNIVVGQEIAVLIRQDVGGTNTGAFGSYWLFPGGTAPTLTVAGDALDLIVGVVVSATEIVCNSVLDLS